MNPTTTEHDHRFPRRPGAAAATGAFRHNAFAPQHHHGASRESSGLRAELQHLNLDFSAPLASVTTAAHGSARDALLRSSAFLPFEQSMERSAQSPEEMQRQDPIAIQVWRFFADTKTSLPQKDRMENLTWRMMHLELRKQRKSEPRRCVFFLFFKFVFAAVPAHPATKEGSWIQFLQCSKISLGGKGQRKSHKANSVPIRPTRHPQNSLLNAPSGIAQLRKTSEQFLPQPELMNIDDYINNDSVGTPAGMALTPTPETHRMADESKTTHSTASAIPIKTRRESPQHLVPQSVPVAVHHQRVQNEFDYVTRHRKTSIDETNRRVSLISRPA